VKRNYPDWIQSYLEFAKYSEAPTKFHFWTAVSVIAGALQRKVWIDQKYFQWLPNFYIIFVSPPGIVSKSTTAAIGMDLLRQVPGIRFGPSSLTWQSLVTALAEAPEAFELPGGDGEMLVQSAITIVASELGSLLDLKDRVMVDVLVDLWDGKRGAWEKWTKTSGNDKIENPFINIIGCTTPAWIQENFTKYLTGGGFTARTVFVYAQEKRQLIPYPARHFDQAHDDMRPKLLQDLEMMKQLVGEYRLNPEAEEFGVEWYKKHNERMSGADPTDDGLNSFLARKQTFLHKLGMILAASRRDELTIKKEDLQFADAMLTSIESELATVFGRISERDEVKDVMDVLKVLMAFKKLPKSVLYRKLFTRMSSMQFDAALNAVIVARRATLMQSGSDLIVTLIEEKSDGKKDPDPLAR
jgi:hypothetical protein